MQLKEASIQYINGQEIIGDFVISRKKLGTGGEATVFKGISISTNKTYAIKCIHFSNGIPPMDEFEVLLKTSAIHSPFLLHLHDAFVSYVDQVVILVLDYCIDSLENYCFSRSECLTKKRSFVKPPLPEQEAIHIFLQISEGALNLWDNNIIHRDIKPENVLYRFDESLEMNIFLLSDFGLSTTKSTGQTQIGTPHYKAPEIIEHKSSYTYLVDIWSLGLTLHELLFGEVFYRGPSKSHIEKKVMNSNYELSNEMKKKISSQTLKLLEMMIQKNPKKRISKENFRKYIQSFPDYETIRKIINRENYCHCHYGSLNKSAHLNYTNASHARGLIENALRDRSLGFFSKSKELLKEAVEIYQQIQGPESIDTAYVYAEYAQELRNNGEYEQAKLIGLKALSVYQKNYGKSDAHMAFVSSILGGIDIYQGNFESAKEYFTNALKINEEYYGEDDIITASTIESLGCAYQNLENFEKAETLYLKSLQINKRHYSENHIRIGEIYYNLASLLTISNKNVDALEYCKKAKKIFESQFGVSNKNTLEAAKLLETIENKIKEEKKVSNNDKQNEQFIKQLIN